MHTHAHTHELQVPEISKHRIDVKDGGYLFKTDKNTKCDIQLTVLSTVTVCCQVCC